MPRDNVTRIDGARSRMKNPRGLANTRAATKHGALEAALEKLAAAAQDEDEDGAYVTVKRPRKYNKDRKEPKPEKRRNGRKPSRGTDWPGAVVLAIVASFCAGASIGVYTVLHGILTPIYGAVAGSLIATIPLVVEMSFGHFAHEAFKHGRPWLAVLLAVPILAAGLTDLTTAQLAPGIARQAHVDTILHSAESATESKPELETKDDTEGKRGKLQTERNNGKLLDLAKNAQDKKNDYTRQRLENARTPQEGESKIPTYYSLLGALGGACFIPLLEQLLRKFKPD